MPGSRFLTITISAAMLVIAFGTSNLTTYPEILLLAAVTGLSTFVTP